MAGSESMSIFRAATAEIARELAPYGFKLDATKRTAVRIGRLFEHHISFRTSRSVNSLQGHVAFDVNATAWSEGFGDFRRQHGIQTPINEACLFDCPIENIFKEPPPYIRYDIGEAAKRTIVLESIKSVIRDEVVMVFDLIEKPSQIASFMESRSISCLKPFNAWRDYKAYVSVALSGREHR